MTSKNQCLNILIGCNQGSKIAQGNYLFFLNNDAQILGNSIPSALDTIKSSEDIGAVGGKFILPDGTLMCQTLSKFKFMESTQKKCHEAS